MIMGLLFWVVMRVLVFWRFGFSVGFGLFAVFRVFRFRVFVGLAGGVLCFEFGAGGFGLGVMLLWFWVVCFGWACGCSCCFVCYECCLGV